MSFFDIHDTIHPASEFNTIPWEKLRPDWKSEGIEWTMGRGGHGLADDRWTIQIFKEYKANPIGISCDIFETPESLSNLINQIKKCAKEDGERSVRNAIITALGL